MSSKQCSKRIQINGVKVAFKDTLVYVVAEGGVRRIRHRDQLPADLTGSGTVRVLYAKKGTAPLETADVWDLQAGWVPDGWRSGTAPARATDAARVLTGEGGRGFSRKPLDELRVLAANSRANATFYESTDSRSRRSRALAQGLARTEPKAVHDLVVDLVERHRLRTSALCVAVDAAVAGHPEGASLIALALNRPDDPGLALQYAQQAYGRIPRVVRNAAASAAVRLYDENAALRFDRRRTRPVDGSASSSTGFTFADVIRVTHAKAASPVQGALFAHLAAGADPDPSALPLLAGRAALARMGQADRAEAYASALDSVRALYATGKRASAPDDIRVRALLSADWRTVAEFAPPAPPAYQDALARAVAARDALVEQWPSLTASRNYAAKARSRARRARYAGNAEEGSRWEEAALAAQAPVDRHRREVRAANDAVALARADAAAAKSALAVEVALGAMSYKDVLANVTKLAGPHVSPEATAYAMSRVADAESARQSNLSLSDVIRAAKAASESTLARGSDGMRHESQWRAWTAAPTAWDAPLSDVTRSLVADALAPLAGKRALVLVDGSGSMREEVATRRGDRVSQTYTGLRRDEVAAFMAGAFKASCAGDVDIVAYSTRGVLVDPGAEDVMGTARAAAAALPGGGTDTWGVMLDSWDAHDVVVILTDEQTSWTLDQDYDSRSAGYWRGPVAPRIRRLPGHVQVVTCNLSGDAPAHAGPSPRHVSLAGVTEDVFVQAGLAVARADEAKSTAVG